MKGYFTGIATTSLIAGTATAFFAAWHFHQVAPFGLLANLIAMPIVSIIIMPFVLFSVLLMPYGLEFILPKSAILIFGSFLILICLLKTKLRYIALLPLLALPFVFHTPIKPDVLISENRCIVVLPSSKILHVIYNPDFIQSSCGRADILVAPRLWWVKCKKRKPELVLNRYDFERFGTHALYIKKVITNAKIESKIISGTGE